MAEGTEKQAKTPRVARGKRRGKDISTPAQRAALTNGSVLFLDGINQQSRQARRFRDLVEGIEEDLGGADSLSMVERSMLRKAAALDVWTEERVTAIGRGEKVDISELTTAINSMKRLYEAIGLKRVPRDVAPDLETIIDGQAMETK